MKSDIIDKDEDEYERIIKCYQISKEKRYIKPPLSEILKNCEIHRGTNQIKKNIINNNNTNWHNRGNNNTNRHNRGNNNNFRNNRNNRNNNIASTNNSNNIGNSNNNSSRRGRNNFNSHFVDLDEFLGD